LIADRLVGEDSIEPFPISILSEIPGRGYQHGPELMAKATSTVRLPSLLISLRLTGLKASSDLVLDQKPRSIPIVGFESEFEI